MNELIAFSPEAQSKLDHLKERAAARSRLWLAFVEFEAVPSVDNFSEAQAAMQAFQDVQQTRSQAVFEIE